MPTEKRAREEEEGCCEPFLTASLPNGQLLLVLDERAVRAAYQSRRDGALGPNNAGFPFSMHLEFTPLHHSLCGHLVSVRGTATNGHGDSSVAVCAFASLRVHFFPMAALVIPPRA